MENQIAASPKSKLPILTPQLGHSFVTLSIPINIFSLEQWGHNPSKHLTNSDLLINFLVDSTA